MDPKTPLTQIPFSFFPLQKARNTLSAKTGRRDNWHDDQSTATKEQLAEDYQGEGRLLTATQTRSRRGSTAKSSQEGVRVGPSGMPDALTNPSQAAGYKKEASTIVPEWYDARFVFSDDSHRPSLKGPVEAHAQVHVKAPNQREV